MSIRPFGASFPQRVGIGEFTHSISNNWAKRRLVSSIKELGVAIREAYNPISFASTLSVIASGIIGRSACSPINNAVSSTVIGISIPPIIYSFCKKLNPAHLDRQILMGSTGIGVAFTSLQLLTTNSHTISFCSNMILIALGVNFSVLAKRLYIRGIFQSEGKEQKIFFLIFGPPASGKMTVGQELAKKSNLTLFHNHVLIEPLLTIFNFTDPHFRNLIQSFRSQIFEEVSQSSLRGIIFTFVWNFNSNQSKQSVDNWSEFFKSKGGRVYAVELVCDLNVRLERNRTENRLVHKASKRDLNKSEMILLENERDWKTKSDNDFYYGDKFLRIDNSRMAASEVAELIIRHFEL